MKPIRGLILLAAAVTLASCSSGSSNPATTAVPSTSAGTAGAAPGKATAVTESEFTITLPSKTLSAGTYTFKVTNKGKFAHNLTVDGAGVQDKATPPSACQISSRRIRILEKTKILSMPRRKFYLVIFPVTRNPKPFDRIFFILSSEMRIIHRKIDP